MAGAFSNSLEVLKCGNKQRVCRELARICAAVRDDEEHVVWLGQEGIHTTLLELLMSKDEEVSEAAAQAIDACVQNCPHGVSFPMSARQLCDSSANPFLAINLGEAEPCVEAHTSRLGQGVVLDETEGSEGPTEASTSSSKCQPNAQKSKCDFDNSTSEALPRTDFKFDRRTSEALQGTHVHSLSCQQTPFQTLQRGQLLGAESAPDSPEESLSSAHGQDKVSSCSTSLPEGPPLKSSLPLGPKSSLKSEACFPLRIKLRKIRERQDRKIGNMLWLSAIILSHWIIRNQRTAIAGKNVLEIGSGLGLCGIVAGRYARSVVLTDFDPVIVRNLEYNIRCNRHLLRERGRFCCARKLDWYDLPVGPSASNEDEETNQSPVEGSWSNQSLKAGPTKAAFPSSRKIHPHDDSSSVENGIIDRNGSENLSEVEVNPDASSCDKERSSGFHNGEAFDVIIGSDVVHEEPMANGVVAVLKRFLAWKGVAIIVNPHSHHRAGVERFREMLVENGFNVEIEQVDKEEVQSRTKSVCTSQTERGICKPLQKNERHSEPQDFDSDVMARFEDELKDVTLELYIISKANQRGF